MNRRALLKTAMMAGIGSACRLDGADEFEQSVVWRSGEDGYHTYRIPALLTAKRGTLLAFCEGRKKSARDEGDIHLLTKSSIDGGRTWSAQQVVYAESGGEEVTIGNPCPVIDERDGTIWMPFCRDNRDVFVAHSTDDGATWSTPIEITETVKKPDWGWYATGPGTGIQMRSGEYAGRLVIPCDHREKVDGIDVKMSHVFHSSDRGATWALGGTVAPHTDECQVVETADGALLINMRNYWGRDGKVPEKGGMRSASFSRDGGASWSELRFEESLIEPVCQASLLRYTLAAEAGRNRLLFSNPASRDRRIRMTVRLSYDESTTWPVSKVIAEGPSAYSSLAALPDGSIGLLWETGSERAHESLTFARFTLGWLSDGRDSIAKG